MKVSVIAEYAAVAVIAFLGVWYGLAENIGAAGMCIAYLILLDGYLDALRGWERAIRMARYTIEMLEKRAARIAA